MIAKVLELLRAIITVLARVMTCVKVVEDVLDDDMVMHCKTQSSDRPEAPEGSKAGESVVERLRGRTGVPGDARTPRPGAAGPKGG